MKYSLISALIATCLLTACQHTQPKPEPRYIPKVVLADSTVLEVSPYRGVCDSAKPMQCLIVKKAGSVETFGIGFNDIIGFEPAVGTAYKVKVRRQIDQNTGKPTGYWQLDEVLSQNIAH